MHDLLVLGSGVAGLTTALHAAEWGCSAIVLTKGELSHSATRYAQGGVAAALAASRGITAEPYTGHAEAWTDRSAARVTDEARAANRAAIEDERHFIDFTRSAMWLGKEHVLIGG